MNKTLIFSRISVPAVRTLTAFFLRGQSIIQPCTDLFHFERDVRFSTDYDTKVARLLANDLLQPYLNTEIQKIEDAIYQEEQALPPKTQEAWTWTRSKTDLVELIYAIFESNCFNRDKISLKRLVNYFENVFGVELGNPYHIYTELKERLIALSF